MSVKPITAIAARDLKVFTDEHYVQHYDPISLDTAGAVHLEKAVGIYLEELVDDTESPVSPAGYYMYKFATFKIVIIRMTKRSLTTTATLAEDIVALHESLTNEAVGTFPTEHLQIISPATVKGEPLGTNAMKYEFMITHHFRKEDA